MSRPVRRSQAIAPFGIGALIDFPGPVSLIHAGQDAWPFDPDNAEHREFRVDDERRLARRLGVDYFVQPPDFRNGVGATVTPNAGLALPFLRFPVWHACPRCGRLHEARYHHRVAPDCFGPVGSGGEKGKPHKRRRTIQTRFVAACEEGHLRDFPWIEWLGLERKDWDGSRPDRWLRLLSTGSASIAGVILVAEIADGTGFREVKRRSLASAFSVEQSGATGLSQASIVCDGQNPALGIGYGGDTAGQPCSAPLRSLLRGASNLYFGDVRSSIFIPEIVDSSVSAEILELLEDFAFRQSLLMAAQQTDNGLLGTRGAGIILKKSFPESDVDPAALSEAVNRHSLHEVLTEQPLIARRLKLQAKTAPDGIITASMLGALLADIEPDWAIDPELLVRPINDWLRHRDGDVDSSTGGNNVSEAVYRAEEYAAFSRNGQEGFPKANLLIRSAGIHEHGSLVRENFSRIALLDKMRETRAFVGFSRIFAKRTTTPAPSPSLIARERQKWLPAVVVRGEGIFLQLDSDRLSQWTKAWGGFHRSRLAGVNANLHEQAERRRSPIDEAVPGFVLLHTLAHLLIGQLVYDCGYGSSSLRERIYFSDLHPPMAGILIYTAAGDSEGTMGGLVRMGEPAQLDAVLTRALDRARWCSSDPVCIDSRGQGPDGCNLAACHACALLPETSCEQQNRMLDRAVLIGTLDQPDTGFFSTSTSQVTAPS